VDAGKGLGDREAGEGQEGSSDSLKKSTNEKQNALDFSSNSLDFSYLWKADDDGVCWVICEWVDVLPHMYPFPLPP
jgi:hypothetical protein